MGGGGEVASLVPVDVPDSIYILSLLRVACATAQVWVLSNMTIKLLVSGERIST